MSTTMTETTTYLGTLDGEHWWSDGKRLPVLMGFDVDDDPDDDEDPDEDESDDEGDEEEDEDDAPADPPEDEDKPRKKKRGNTMRPERQAAQYRVQRNEARTERDALRLEVAFLRAAGGTFVDARAAFRLCDQGLMSIGEDGSVVGAEEAVEAVAISQPFLLPAPTDDKPTPERNPFEARRSSGRVFNGKKPVAGGSYDVAKLAQTYPALRRGR